MAMAYYKDPHSTLTSILEQLRSIVMNMQQPVLVRVSVNKNSVLVILMNIFLKKMFDNCEDVIRGSEESCAYLSSEMTELSMDETLVS